MTTERFTAKPVKLLDWTEVFGDFSDSEKEKAILSLGEDYDYSFGSNAGTLISVWDVIKIYSSLNGCDHRVLKALAETDFVVYWA